MIKKALHIAVVFLLSLNIVFGYSGITIFKMVCHKKNGKTSYSLVRASNKNNTPKKSCCKSNHATQIAQQNNCCEYSYHHSKISTHALTKPHYKNTYVNFVASRPRATSIVWHIYAPQHQATKPLQGVTQQQQKQPFQSLIQVYLI